MNEWADRKSWACRDDVNRCICCSCRLLLLSSRRHMRVFGPIVQVSALSVLDVWKKLTLSDALRALCRERGKAWNAACDAAEAAGRKRRPSLRPYGIAEIKRPARRLGVGPTHWSGED
jgi:hypothetical protein